MQNPARWFVFTPLLLIAVSSAHAQGGKADLRYVAPMPSVMTVTIIDSIASKASGLGPEDIVTNGFLRTTIELRMVATDSGVAVNAALKELKGSMTSPMGETPFTSPDVAPVDMHFGVRGPALEMGGAMPNLQTNPGTVIGATRLQSALPWLPGRTLRIGETWVDTIRNSMPVGELTTDMIMITHGTYVADTTVNGKLLNVLQFRSNVATKMTGKIQGNEMDSEMTATGDERLLWDSSLHVPVFRDGVGRTEMTIKMSGGDSMVNQSKVRSIVTSEF